MLKLQKPYNINEYVAIDPSRTNELHQLGFMPEYLYNNMMYFRATVDLSMYLEKGTKPKSKTYMNNTKVEKEQTTSNSTNKKKAYHKE